MARRFFVQSDKGVEGNATDEQLKGFRTQIEAKGWTPIAQLASPNGIVFELSLSNEDYNLRKEEIMNAISGGSAIGVPENYPRDEDPVVKRY